MIIGEKDLYLQSKSFTLTNYEVELTATTERL